MIYRDANDAYVYRFFELSFTLILVSGQVQWQASAYAILSDREKDAHTIEQEYRKLVTRPLSL